MSHKHDLIEYAERKVAKAQLEQNHLPPNSVPQVVERLDLIEKIIGIKQ